MKSLYAAVAMTTGVLGLMSFTAYADSLDTLPYALSGGTPNLDARLRYEGVDQDNYEKEAQGLFARARLGYTTGKWNNLDSQFEFESLNALGSEQFNSTQNGRTQYPTIVDPTAQEINQFWVRYTGLPGTSVKLGRQRLLFDNARWIGNVAWRMNEQTFDGVLLTGTWLPKLTADYFLLTNVNPVSAANVDVDTGHLAHLNYDYRPWLNASAYAYLLDFAANAALPPTAGARVNNQKRDTATYGLRLTGTQPLQAVKDLKLKYAVEYAQQQSYADSPSSVKGRYELAEVAALYHKASLTFGYELLSGDGTYGTQTPLATIHAFDGWADQFLTTPATGLRRIYGNFGYQIEKCSLNVIYQDFSPDADSASHYGQELNVQITRPLMKVFSIGAKYANYFADNAIPGTSPARPVDVSKAWAWIEYKF